MKKKWLILALMVYSITAQCQSHLFYKRLALEIPNGWIMLQDSILEMLNSNEEFLEFNRGIEYTLGIYPEKNLNPFNLPNVFFNYVEVKSNFTDFKSFSNAILKDKNVSEPPYKEGDIISKDIFPENNSVVLCDFQVNGIGEKVCKFNAFILLPDGVFGAVATTKANNFEEDRKYFDEIIKSVTYDIRELYVVSAEHYNSSLELNVKAYNSMSSIEDYEEVPAVVIDKMMRLNRDALSHAKAVNYADLDVVHKDCPKKFEELFVLGLTKYVFGHLHNVPVDYLFGQVLLDKWWNWYDNTVR